MDRNFVFYYKANQVPLDNISSETLESPVESATGLLMFSEGVMTSSMIASKTSQNFVSETNSLKKHGGWPKGRKRKTENILKPPKAPATGYVLYLNEKRKLYKNLPFPKVTTLLGHEWTRMV